MPQADVRNAIALYLDAQGFKESLNVVGIYKAIPTFFPSAGWSLPGGFQYATLLAVHIDHWSESRITMPAEGNTFGSPTGQKQRNYAVSILVQQLYDIPTFYAPGEDEASYTDVIDFTLDSIVEAIQRDATLGTGGSPIFQAGQDQDGLRTQQDIPRQDGEGQTLFAWNRIDFNLTEIINA